MRDKDTLLEMKSLFEAKEHLARIEERAWRNHKMFMQAEHWKCVADGWARAIQEIEGMLINESIKSPA